ncbi:AAA family ATPase [Aquincola sp. J276]|uniref:AAA family ATPase n=1 Tax=Aquincola sp. J276 TaxID=2898432 RepID=UPI0021518FE1|nr:AAA family ATPase [Aquincola sp. J276]MCR5865357.1 AAA family ATPase [Aquincola sp. J276]
MKLRRLCIRSFKRFREPLLLEGFADGLNLFAAPNECGKSTVAEAIRAAFFERHRSNSVEHLRPWGEPSATPTVEVDFELGGRQHRLTKAFLGKKRCELVIAGQPPLDGAAAEDHLAGLLGFKFPGKGASAPEHMGIPGLLWIRQGTAHELADAVQYAADHLRQVLGESMGELTASGGDALLRTVEGLRNELLTPATGNPKGEYGAALARQAELAGQLQALDREIGAYQDSVDRLAGLRRAHERDAQARPWAGVREQHQAAVARLQAAQGLEARQQAEQAALQQWRTQAAALRSELDALARDDAAVATRQQALSHKAAMEAAAQAELQSWQRRHEEAMDADAQARQLQQRVQAAATRAELARHAAELDASLGALADALRRAQEERQRGIRLQAEAQALAIAPAELQRLKRVAQSLREADVRLEAAATTLEFELLDGCQVRLGDEPLQGRGRRTVVSRTDLVIEGLGRIGVQPGGADIPALKAQRDALATEQASLLQGLRVAHLAEAEERARQAVQRQQEAQASGKVLQALAPQGVEALQAELAARTARAGELRAALAGLPAAAEDGQAGPDPASVQAQAERAAAALAAAAQALSQARVAAGKAQSDHEAARQELAAAQATAQDARRGQRKIAAQQALVDTAAQEATAQQRVEATAAELKALNLALLRQDVDRLSRSAQQLEEAHERRRQDITRLEVELETKGALGLEEQRAERERELEAASRRATELARRAAALDHLLGLLREKRSALARRLRAPLQKHLDHYLGILFPGAHVEVADDLSPGAITRTGPRGPESGSFEDLSIGAREQMGIVARLAYADLLQEAGRPTLLILDDALVNTDEDRLGQMKRVLYDAAQRHQVLIFTCHPAAWRDLGVVPRGVGT